MCSDAEIYVGFFGKLPARGDFVASGLPGDFITAWDGWLQTGLAASQAAIGEGWVAAWLEAPVWCFVLPPGLCGARAAIGLFLPSVDKVGRYFPLTLAALRVAAWSPLTAQCGRFLALAESAGRAALAEDLTPEELSRRVAAAWHAETAAGPAGADEALPEVRPGEAAFWTVGAPRVAAQVMIVAALPEPAGFMAMLEDEAAA